MGIEISVITQKIIEYARSSKLHSSKWDFLSQTDHDMHFFSFREEVEVVIERLKTRHSTFLVKNGDYELILSQLFFYLV